MTIKKEKWSVIYDDKTKKVTSLFLDKDPNDMINIFLDFVENILYKNKAYNVNVDENKSLNNDIKLFHEYYSNI